MREPRVRGFTLVEVLAAVAILTAALLSLAPLLGAALKASREAERATVASALAVERIEQLRSLAWGFDEDGQPAGDTTTDLSGPQPSGAGTGLAASPPGTLDRDVPGFVDYLAGDGRWLGRGSRPPPGTAYVRRWAVVPLAADPDNGRVLEVVVLPAAGTREPDPAASAAGTRLVSLKVRAMG